MRRVLLASVLLSGCIVDPDATGPVEQKVEGFSQSSDQGLPPDQGRPDSDLDQFFFADMRPDQSPAQRQPAERVYPDLGSEWGTDYWLWEDIGQPDGGRPDGGPDWDQSDQDPPNWRDRCESACQRLTDCSVAICDGFDNPDRARIYEGCFETCLETPALAVILDTQESCEQSVDFISAVDPVFAADCLE